MACRGHVGGHGTRDGGSVDSLIDRRGPLTDYLVEEVLDLTDPATATFLLESSVLERFTAGQLDVVLARDDCAQMLDALADAGNLAAVEEARRTGLLSG